MRGRILLALAAIACTSTRAAGQDGDGTTITFAVSPSVVDFNSYGGGFGAAVAHVRVSRRIGRDGGAELSMFVLAPLGGATTEPLCTIGATCHSYATPNYLQGFIASGYRYLGSSGFRPVVGGGWVSASGGEGPSASSTFAGLVGFDWEARGTSLRPSVGVRVVSMSQPLYGARQLLIPGAGFAF